jgi:hypothetical protein
MNNSEDAAEPADGRRVSARRKDLHPDAEIHLGGVIDEEQREAERRAAEDRREEPRTPG